MADLAPEDVAGAAALGIAAVPFVLLNRIPIDTPRENLIDTINKLVDNYNKLLQKPEFTYSKSVVSGWTVFDYGNHKRYVTSKTVSGLAVTNGQRTSAGTVAVPAGRTISEFRIFVSWEGGFAGHATVGSEAPSGTTWELYVGNEYSGGSLSFTGKINVLLEEIT